MVRRPLPARSSASSVRRAPAAATAAVIVAAAAVLGLAACSSAPNEVDRQLLQPVTATLAEPADFGIVAERVEIPLHASASLTGWWLPHGNGEKHTVVLFHDADVNASAVHPYWRFLHDAGCQVLVFDPRGYGASKGASTFRTWLYDLPALFDWLRARPDVDPQRIGVFGTGLGSLAAYWAARTQHCQAIVVEHLPSLREQLRAAQGGDGGPLAAMSLGLTEAASLPDEIEPLDVAERVKVPALFVVSDGEPARDRLAAVRTFLAHGGDKQLWVMQHTGRAPHGMLTHDGEYQRRIATFLRGALNGTPTGAVATGRKVDTARDGQLWWQVEVTTGVDAARWGNSPPGIEVCAVLLDGTTHHARTFGETRTRLKLPAEPLAVGAVLVPDVERDATDGFRRPATPRQHAAQALDASWTKVETLRNGALPPAERAALRAELDAAAAKAPFPPEVAAELADVWALLGKDLATSADPAERAAGRALLERAVAAVPSQPHLHVWPGPKATYGYPADKQDAIDTAKKLLGN